MTQTEPVDLLAALEAERARATRLEAERDEARRKLFPYADATEISGMSWNGFYLIGDSKSITEFRRVEHRSAQLEEYRRAFDERIAVEKARAEEANAAIARIWKVLGIETYAQAGGKEISEIVAGLISRAERAEASAAAKDAALRRAMEWFWPADDTSSEACRDSPWEIVQEERDGVVVAISCGGIVQTRHYASLPPADDSDSDDTFDVDEATAELAAAKIAEELARRAALAPGHTAPLPADGEE